MFCVGLGAEKLIVNKKMYTASKLISQAHLKLNDDFLQLVEPKSPKS